MYVYSYNVMGFLISHIIIHKAYINTVIYVTCDSTVPHHSSAIYATVL